jgi:hypothetical protein
MDTIHSRCRKLLILLEDMAPTADEVVVLKKYSNLEIMREVD